MRTLTLTCFLCFLGNLCVVAQPKGFSKILLDSLEKKLTTLPNDTNRINTLIEVAVLYSNTNVEKSILLGEEALRLTRKFNYENGFRKVLGPLSFQYSISGQWAKGLELALEGKERYKDNLYELGNFINMAQLAYEKQGDYQRCLEECQENIRMFNAHPKIEFNPVDKWATHMTASQMYSKEQEADSALIYAFKCLSYAQSIPFNTGHFVGYAHSAIGIGYLTQNKPDSAIAHLHLMRSTMVKINNQFALQETQIYLARAMQKKGALDSMYYYAKTAYEGAVKMDNDINEMDAALILSEYFEKSNPPKSLFYLKRHNAIKEKHFTQDQTNKRYFLESEQRNKLAELEKKEINAKNRIRQNALLGGLFTFVLLAGVLIFTNRRKKALNDTLQQQKLQIEKQNQDLTNSGHELALKNRDLETTLVDLRITQTQLIQSEKLASLGELTAGIAHEIQNPLNFVNNFAEVSAEMIDELKEELGKGDLEEVKAIAEDLQVNLGKINHHGGRASSIVRGMLEHSRTSSGVKEPTNLNTLADEFLRLAYHGLRAKDSSFNCKMETHFEPDLPVVSVISQDIGRVLLNLINNAFYAVQQRTVETLHATSLQHLPYQPTVTVSTQKTDNQIIISVQDNGNGIPEAIREKIFQPFFTTKPTGQGTGLGLSLAYDIITKGHGGKIHLESTENQGSTFTIELPLTNPKN
ncbi:sensor histidine kinase [Haliscomenobacter sp.]|uniref:sensor histidine kinase n=1 Tax=Haliscomenobacter sp. TaxID=2717303 RepID=UPI003BAAC1F7